MKDLLGHDQPQRIAVGPTAYALFGRRMLVAAEIISKHLPVTINNGDPLHILLSLLIAEEEGREVAVFDLAPPEMIAPHMLRRWINALRDEGWVRVEEKAAILTSSASNTLKLMTKEIYDAQRCLDYKF